MSAEPPRLRIAIDAMGGDHAPREVVVGAVESARRRPQVTHILVGPKEQIDAEIQAAGGALPNLEVFHASQAVGMDEHPVEALRGKPDSSIRRSLGLVKRGQAEAFFSAGNTGACVAGATISLGLLDAVKRPGIAVPIPTEKGFATLIDAGANPACKPIHLVQYAVMGSVYVRCVDPARPNPAVGLLNVGEEVGKGNETLKEAHDSLRRTSLNFRGNVEGHQIFSGQVDVIVCDGFVGNAILKAGEALSSFLLRKVADGVAPDPATRKRLAEAAELVDFSTYGGAPLLGVRGVVLIGHGRSRARAITSALRAAAEVAGQRLNERIVEELKKISWWGRLADWMGRRGEGAEAS